MACHAYAPLAAVCALFFLSLGCTRPPEREGNLESLSQCSNDYAECGELGPADSSCGDCDCQYVECLSTSADYPWSSATSFAECDRIEAKCESACQSSFNPPPSNCVANCKRAELSPTGGALPCYSYVCANNPAYKTCKGTCTAVQTDRNNCGSCGNICPSTKTCQLGACVDIDIKNAQVLPVDLICSPNAAPSPESIQGTNPGIWDGGSQGIAITEMQCRLKAPDDENFRNQRGLQYMMCLDDSGWFGSKESYLQGHALKFLQAGYIIEANSGNPEFTTCAKYALNQLACSYWQEPQDQSRGLSTFLSRFNSNCGAIPSPKLNAADGGCYISGVPANAGGSGAFNSSVYETCILESQGSCPAACCGSCCYNNCKGNIACTNSCLAAQDAAKAAFSAGVGPLSAALVCSSCDC